MAKAKKTDLINSDLQKRLAELEEANTKYEAIIGSLSEGLLIADMEGEVLFANEQVTEITGIPVEKLLGKKVTELFLPKSEWANLNKRLQDRTQGISEAYELELKRKNGEVFWASINASPYKNPSGEIIGSIALVRDITDQKIMFGQLRSTTMRLGALIENMHAGILVENEHREIALTNEVFCKMFGIDAKPYQLMGLDCIKAAEESKHLFTDPDNFTKRLVDVTKEKKPVTGEELNLKDGRVFERDYIPVFFEEKYLGHLWQYRDITKRRGKERELIEAMNNAEEAQKAEESFLANMSHELRTPLNGLVGMTNLLFRTDVSPEQKDFLSAIKASADTLQVIINDILDFSKIQKGEVKFDNMPFSLGHFIDNVLLTVKPLTDDKGIMLLHDIAKGLPGHVIGDVTRLNQILINLLNNAIRFTEKGHVKLVVEIKEETEDEVTLYVAVEDTGVGISPENQELIFERFKQANNNQTTEHRGTGLGLPIVKQLLKLQGSDIHMNSEKGKGSVFFFELTLTKHHGLEGKAEGSFPSEADLEEFKGAKILIVEDNILNQKVAANFMEKWGFVVELSDNGKQAIDLVEKNEYDLVLMDIQMPVMDGLEASLYIRNEMNNQKLPILALTASVLSSNKDKILAAGMNDFIPKPFEPDMLLEKVVSHLRGVNEEVVVMVNLNKKPSTDSGSFVDLDFLYQNSFGNKEFMTEMIELFLKETPKVLERLRQQVGDKNWDGLEKEAHKYKSSLSLMGVHQLSDTITKIETIAKEKSGVEELPELLNDVLLVSQKAIEELEIKLKSIHQRV